MALFTGRPLVNDPNMSYVAYSRAVEVNSLEGLKMEYHNAAAFLPFNCNVAEIIARTSGGPMTWEIALNAWRNSPEHAAALYDPNRTIVGAAVYGDVAVAALGHKGC